MAEWVESCHKNWLALFFVSLAFRGKAPVSRLVRLV